MTSLHALIEVRRMDGFVLDVAMDIEPGVTTALLGPNGAGKTTLVAALAGLVAIDAGTIALGERVFDDPAAGVFVPPEQRRVGVVFQDHMLFPHMTALENVAFGLRTRRGDRRDATRRAGEWLERVGLAGFEDHRPGTLSGGQAQRVAVARALAAEPDVLLLDEPLASLDVAARIDLRHLLGEHLAGFGGPRVVITHDPAEAFLLADTIVVLEDGRVTQAGTADDIRLRPLTRYAADLAGINLVRGVSRGGEVDVGGHTLHVPADAATGTVVVTIHPTAISVHPAPPGGSPRNTWQATVERIESHGDRVRVRVGAPLPLTIEITGAARSDLGIEPGASVWVAIKATEIRVARDEGRTDPGPSLKAT